VTRVYYWFALVAMVLWTVDSLSDVVLIRRVLELEGRVATLEQCK
jgi:hypothetical protein